jgi:hypothetical protein
LLSQLLKNVIKIEIMPPQQLDSPSSESMRVVIDSSSMISKILSTLDLEVSPKEAIQGCKLPPGFQVRFVTPEETIEADITLSGHKHLLIKWGVEGETVHYELPSAFEKCIYPYLQQSLES